MARMTEEEANILEEEITNADITLKPGKGGIFTRQRELIDALDRASADYIMIRAMASYFYDVRPGCNDLLFSVAHSIL